MAPKHVERRFWWEILFVTVLLFLLGGVWSQRQDRIVAVAQAAALVPPIVLTAVAIPLPVVPALALQ